MLESSCILYLLNPGRTSRAYLIGLINATRRMGIKHQVIDLSVVWERQQRGDAKNLTLELYQYVRSVGITHAIGYAYNGIDIARLSDLDGSQSTSTHANDGSLFVDLGIKHLSLWTDHPNWCMNAAALNEPLLSRCRHSEHYHFLKSASAAAECTSILQWPKAQPLHMAEDYESLRPVPQSQRIVEHQVVMLLSDAGPVCEEIKPFLEVEDPDPSEISRCIKPRAIKAALKVLKRSDSAKTPLKHPPEAFNDLLEAWAQLKIANPHSSLWSLSKKLDAHHSALMSELGACPERWYAVTQALRELVAWRRNFWPAWLARRVSLGVYGCDASCWGINQDAAARQWVAYDKQVEVYAKAPCALNINAAHDEEGMTHKPFQIAAAGVGCVHHFTRGLDDVFDIQEHLSSFERGPELLAAIQTAPQQADALLAHVRRHHRWEDRLTTMLELSSTEHIKRDELSASSTRERRLDMSETTYNQL